MRKASGYGSRAQNHDDWNGHTGSEESREEETPYLNQRTYSNHSHRTSRSSSTGQAPQSSTTPSAPRKPQQSGIPRPGTITPSRLPSALKTPRSRSYSSSSSIDSRTTVEEIPPLPRNSIPPGQVYSDKMHGDRVLNPASHTGATNSLQARSQSGLPRRSASTSRPGSRSRSRNSRPGSNDLPPPLPGSNSDSDGLQEFEALSTSIRDYEKTPNSASWAKDRRRFANPGMSPSHVSSQVSQPDATSSPAKPQEHSGIGDFIRKSSFTSKLPLPPVTAADSRASSQPRVPSGTAKLSRVQEGRRPLEAEAAVRSPTPSNAHSKEEIKNHSSYQPPQSQPNSSRRYSTAHHAENTVAARTKANSKNVAGRGPYHSQRQDNVAGANIKPDLSGKKAEQDAVHISSMEDMPLPTPPLPQAGFTPKNSAFGPSRAEDEIRTNTVSSPVETLLMGSNPGSAATSRRISTPVRFERESSVYVPASATPSTPSTRRFSQPFPGSKHRPSHVSIRNETAKEQEDPPTILQRLGRRASFSARKSPNSSNIMPKSLRAAGMAKSPIEVEHDDTESPFELDIVTPRAALGSATALRYGRLESEIGAAQKDSAQRQKNRQSVSLQSNLPPMATNIKKPHSKAVDNVTAVQGDVGKLGSPFMGDGSPRFGIDERFRSPKAKSSSGLRNMLVDESREEDAQELFDYYTSDETAENTQDYLVGDIPIATVLSSPADATRHQFGKPSTHSSSIVRNKKQSQHQRDRRPTVHDDQLPSAISSHGSQAQTPRVRTPSRVTFSPHPPDTIRQGSRGSSESSMGSRFSDSPEERDGSLPSQTRQSSGIERNNTWESDKNLAGTGRSYWNGPQSPKANSPTERNSRLPLPKKRNTNSALFRALEQPYECSPFSSNTPTDASSNSLHTNADRELDSSPENNSEQLHTVSSNLSSLNGDKVGDIRWSGTYELSSATDVLFHNINHLDSKITQPRVVIQEPSDAYTTDETEDELGGSTYSDEVDYVQTTPDRPDFSQSPVEQPDVLPTVGHGKRMSIQDKRKAIHESWRASLEGEQFEGLEATLDPTELDRQRALREFHESEEAYVDILQTVLRLFVQPLRTQNQRRWISGLDAGVMRLFDWLDDIANLHDQLLSALDSLRQNNQSALIGFSDVVRPFVPMMELYQPYVVRVDAVSKRIAAMTLDMDSDFGEFIRMKSDLPECNQSNLEEMLSRPVKRLQEYIETFARILTLTPRGHQDYLATFSLLHSMHAVSSVLFEVRSQEEEYNLVKNLLARVRGLPSGIQIAIRGRRILAQGILQQIHLPEGLSISHQTLISHPSGSKPAGRSRSGSESTAKSSATDSSKSSTARLKYSSTEYSMRSDSSAGSYVCTSQDARTSDRISFLPHVGSAVPRTSRSRSRSRTGPELAQPQLESTDTYVLVFTDVVLLAKPVSGTSRLAKSSSGSAGSNEWCAFEMIGIFCLLGIDDCSRHYGFEHLVSLDLFPLDNQGDTRLLPSHPILFNLQQLEENATGARPLAFHTHQEWLASFQKCHLHTLRSISFSNGPRGVATPGPHNAPPHTPSFFTMNILSGDFELPKSPSQRCGYSKQHGTSTQEHVDEEREERGFWARRFEAVFSDTRRTYEGYYPSIHSNGHGQVASKQRMTKTCRSSGNMI